MSTIRIGSLILLTAIIGLGASTTSRGEDLGLPPGNLAGYDLASTRTNAFVPAMPGGRFVITVAFIAPAPSSTTGGGTMSACESARFRVDTLSVDRALNTVDVELGDIKSLAPGQVLQIVHDVPRGTGAGMPTWDLDLMGFRLKSEGAAARCGLVASAQFYADPLTRTPISVGIIPDLGASPRVPSTRGR